MPAALLGRSANSGSKLITPAEPLEINGTPVASPGVQIGAPTITQPATGMDYVVYEATVEAGSQLWQFELEFTGSSGIVYIGFADHGSQGWSWSCYAVDDAGLIAVPMPTGSTSLEGVVLVALAVTAGSRLEFHGGAAVAQPPFVSTNDELFNSSIGLCIHFPTTTDIDSFLGEGLFTCGRVGLDWSQVYLEQTPGEYAYDWEWQDACYALLADHGIEGFGWLGYGHQDFMADPDAPIDWEDPVWQEYTPDRVRCCYPPDNSAWRGYCADTAARYGDEVSVWDIWNEPNAEYWQGTVAEFNETFITAVEELRAVNPDVEVLYPDSAGLRLGDIKSWDALADYTDIYDVHAYRIYPEQDLGILKQFRDYAWSQGKDYWCTEVGWSAIEEDTTPVKLTQVYVFDQGVQAANLVKNYVLLYAAGCKRTFWYDLEDDGPDPNHIEMNFGLLEHGSAVEKPAAQALRTLVGFLDGYRYLGWTDLGDRQVYLYLYENGANYRAIGWYFDPDADQRQASGHEVRQLPLLHVGAGPVQDMYGADVTTPQLELSRHPVFIDGVWPQLATSAAANYNRIQLEPKYRGSTASEAWVRFIPTPQEHGLHPVVVDEDATLVLEQEGCYTYARTDLADSKLFLDFAVSPGLAYDCRGELELELVLQVAPVVTAGTQFLITYDQGEDKYVETTWFDVPANPEAYNGVEAKYVPYVIPLPDAAMLGSWGWSIRVGANPAGENVKIHRIAVRIVN